MQGPAHQCDSVLFLAGAVARLASSPQPGFLTALSRELADVGKSQVARMAAGLQLKNYLTSKAPEVRQQYQQMWLSFDPQVRLGIKSLVSHNWLSSVLLRESSFFLAGAANARHRTSPTQISCPGKLHTSLFYTYHFLHPAPPILTPLTPPHLTSAPLTPLHLSHPRTSHTSHTLTSYTSHLHTLRLTPPPPHIQCVAYIAAAELPVGQWGELIPTLLNNVTSPQSTEALKEASLETIGYVCEEIVREKGGPSLSLLTCSLSFSPAEPQSPGSSGE